MAGKRIADFADEGALEARVRSIVSDIKTREDPDTLTAFRDFYRTHVPIAMRPYFTAYLVKQILGSRPAGKFERGQRFDHDARTDRGARARKPEKEQPRKREERREAPAAQEAPRLPREPATRPLDPEIAVQLFVSVGRNRKAYARELVQLITTKASIDREALGDVRVLDNYSFVQVKREVGQTVIDALDGTEFRGRRITVNFARKKEGETSPKVRIETTDTISTASDSVEAEAAEATEGLSFADAFHKAFPDDPEAKTPSFDYDEEGPEESSLDAETADLDDTK